MKKKPGRPKKNPGEHQVYNRIAVLPQTYVNIKVLSRKEGKAMIDWLDSIVNSVKK